jgi:cob(I)alamin adenosyltransferase
MTTTQGKVEEVIDSLKDLQHDIYDIKEEEAIDRLQAIINHTEEVINQLEGWADTYGVEDSARDELFHIIASIHNDGILGEEV